MAERDRVQRMLEPLLPGRVVERRARLDHDEFGVVVQAAGPDGGIELPDDLRDWVKRQPGALDHRG